MRCGAAPLWRRRLRRGNCAARSTPLKSRAAQRMAGLLGLSEVEEIHRTKTAALLGASAELGAIAGGAGPERAVQARKFGLALGMCFQAMDDVLDVTGDAQTLGKTPGKDLGAEKGTLVAALGLEGAQAQAAQRASEAHTHANALGLGDLGAGLIELLLRRKS